MSHNKNLIITTVENYAKALNSGNIDEIVFFYSKDGVFMPQGFPTLSKNLIGKNKKDFFQKSSFTIVYSSIEVSLDEGFAFVNTNAETHEKDFKSEKITKKISRDFFVFKKEGREWKIFRYIFNNVELVES